MAQERKDWKLLDAETAGAASIKLCDFLLGNILGQPDPIKRICAAIDIHNAGFQEEDKPIHKGLFLGPSGVGKTLVAEMLALHYFGSRSSFTRIACETYSEDHAISRLIGSPPGYVGYDKPPIFAQAAIDKWAIPDDEKEQTKKLNEAIKKTAQEIKTLEENIIGLLAKKFFDAPPSLTDATKEATNIDKILRALVAQHAYNTHKMVALASRSGELVKNVDKALSIILFDEIEKASPKLHNIILNILDKAEIVLANGGVTKFNNSIIIMTSNANSGVIAGLMSKKPKLGFHIETDADAKAKDIDLQIYEKSIEAARKFLLPEFIARVDDISVFRPLSHEILTKIYDLELRKFKEKYLDHMYVNLEVDELARQFIVAEATDKPENGARLIKEKISKYLKRQLARLKNRKEFLAGDTIHVVLALDVAGNVLLGNNGKPIIEYYKESGSK